MKSRLVTIATPAIVYDCIELLANQYEYSHTQGYEHRVIREVTWPDLHPSFSKVAAIDEALRDDCEIVVWADADVAFLDMTWQIGNLVGLKHWMAGLKQANWPPPGSPASKQWAYICAGLTVWKNCPEAREYVTEWRRRCEEGSPGILPGNEKVKVTWHPFEQYYSDELNRERNFQGIYAASHKEIGCFSSELWNDGVKYEPGMPTVHFAGPNPWPDRRQTFLDHYLDKVKRA